MPDRNKFSHKAHGVFSIVECVGYEDVLEQGKIQPDPFGCQEFGDFFTKWSSNEALGTKSTGIRVCKFICWHVPLVCSFPRCTASWTSCPWCNGENIPQRSTCDQEPTLPSCLWRYSTCRWSRTAVFYGYHPYSELNIKHLGWERQKILFGHGLFVFYFISFFFILKPQRKAWPLPLPNQPRCCRRTEQQDRKRQSWILTLDEYKGQFSPPQLWMSPVLLPPALAALWSLLELSRKSRTNWTCQTPTPPGCSPWAPPNIDSIHQNLQRQVCQSMPSIQTDF